MITENKRTCDKAIVLKLQQFQDCRCKDSGSKKLNEHQKHFHIPFLDVQNHLKGMEDKREHDINAPKKSVVIDPEPTKTIQEEMTPIRASEDSLMEIAIITKQNDHRDRPSTILSTFMYHDRDVISRAEWEEKVSRTSSATPSQSIATSTGTSGSTSSRDSRKGEIVRKVVSNFNDYKEFLKNYDTTKSLYIFFTGTNSPDSGYSWCKDCKKASSVIERALKYIHSSIYLTVTVGLQEEWDDKLNPFRLDRRTKLNVIPTLWKFRTPRKLEGKYCMKKELIELLFEDDTDNF